MRKVVICLDSGFPRENAGSNRVLYLAKAIVRTGRKVIVVSHGSSGQKSFEMINKEITCKRTKYYSDKLNFYLHRKVFSGFDVLAVLKKEILNEDDSVFVYGSNSLFVKPILKYCNKRGIKSWLDVVEWHQPFQYKFGRINPRYISSKLTFNNLTQKCFGIISISKFLHDHFVSLGYQSTVLPVMIDKEENDFSESICNESNIIRLIYPGNPNKKDDFKTMLQGISLLRDNEMKRIKFISTGVSKEYVNSIVVQNGLERISDCIECQGRVSFEKLNELYKSVDFLFFSRPENTVTKANFPSKIPELMQYGVVPIVPKIGDYVRYLKDGDNCVLFDGNSPELCADAIRRVLSLNTKEIDCMKKNARLCAVESFDYRKWASVIDDMLGGV